MVFMVTGIVVLTLLTSSFDFVFVICIFTIDIIVSLIMFLLVVLRLLIFMNIQYLIFENKNNTTQYKKTT